MANPEHVERLKQGVEAWNQWRRIYPKILPDLSGCILKDANLSEANLRSVNLSNAILRSADLSRADLQGASLIGAGLNDADLSGADLRDANLRDANLSNADLANAWFSYASFSGAYLPFANLSGADLSDANLSNANLSGADLSDAILSDAILSNANLSNADLSGADLSSVNLSNTNLTDTNLSNVNLNAVQALGTVFQSATLTGACIKDWNINANTDLQEVICKYIFTSIFHFPKTERTEFTDRLPHDPTKTFASGDFAKLVQQSLHTVSLIFREGLDWRAFAYSFQQLQVQYANEQIAVQTIENKGDGTVVVKLAVAPGVDKGNIEQSFWRGFETAQKTIAGHYETRLEDKDKHINQLFVLLQQSQEKLGEVPKLMAENSKSETYNTTVTGNVGNFTNKMQDNASQHATQNIGASLDEITTLIRSMRGIAESFPAAQRTEVIEQLEDLETDIQQPPEKRKLSRMKAALLALMGIAAAVSGAVTSTNEFVGQVQELSEKLGIPLPIEQVEPQEPIDVRADGSAQIKVEQPEQFQAAHKTPLEIFEDLGLVGCFEGDPDLSTNYKAIITDHLDEKHRQGRL